MSRESDLGWIAGFFDGEGNVSYARSRPSRKSGKVSPQLCAQIAQKGDNREVLEFFQSVVGFGKIYGPYKYTTPAGREDFKYVLVYNTEEVFKLLILLKPYLKSQKTSDFQRALVAYYAHSPEITQQDIERIEKLNRKKEKKHGKAST